MKIIKHIVTAEQDGARLDQLVSELTGVSRSQVQHAIEEQRLKLNGEPVKKSGHKVKAKDHISGPVNPAPLKLKPQEMNLDIIAETDDYIVINKDAGVVVHPDDSGHGDGTLLNALLAHTQLSDGSAEERPGVVHRLDKDTSGVLIMAKNNKTHEILAKAFHDREVGKTYLALVSGRMKTPTGRIEAPLRRSTKQRTQMAIHHQGKNAITHFEVLAVYKECSLLKVRIETGRTHQIRVHMASIGHPVVGDVVYGDVNFNREFRKNYGLKRQFLHAHQLEIVGQHFEGPLKKDLEEVLDQLQ